MKEKGLSSEMMGQKHHFTILVSLDYVYFRTWSENMTGTLNGLASHCGRAISKYLWETNIRLAVPNHRP